LQVLACLLPQRDSCKRSIRTAQGTKRHPNIGPRVTLAVGSGAASPLRPVYSHGVLPLPLRKKIHILVRACHHLWMLSVMTGPSRAHAVPHGRSGRRSTSWSSCGRWPSRRCVRAPANPQRPNILPFRHMTALHDGASRRTLLLLRAPSCEKMGGAAARVPA